MELKLLSLNTRGFTQPFRNFLSHNLLFEADIFCFQETQISDPLFFVPLPKSAEDHVFGPLPSVNKAAF